MKKYLEQAKIELEQQYRHLVNRLDTLHQQMRDEEPTWSMQSERQHLYDQLQLFERSRQRMQSDNYGLCLSCGQPINLERLLLVPYAETCVRCHQTQPRHHQPNLRPKLA